MYHAAIVQVFVFVATFINFILRRISNIVVLFNTLYIITNLELPTKSERATEFSWRIFEAQGRGNVTFRSRYFSPQTDIWGVKSYKQGIKESTNNVLIIML